jgi:excisionase family DNA binding protein
VKREFHDVAITKDSDRLLSIEEVASLLGIPTQTLYDWRTRRKGPKALRVGRYVRYRREDVRAWIEAQLER